MVNASENLPRILIVDDTLRNVQLIGTLLKIDYQINVATDGKKAIEMVEKIQPDLILMDVMMPVMDGFEACRRLKESKAFDEIPVIFLTARNRKEDILKGFEAGGVDYIAKPFNTMELKARVKTHIELRMKTLALRSLSELDGLTLIPNRRRFQEFLGNEWSRCRRTKSYLAVIMIDIDYFKLFNDTYGHLAGDDCLKRVANTLKSMVKRPGDLVARYGGEEFVIVLGGTDTENASHFAEEICKEINKLAILHEKSVASSNISISAGVASVIPDSNLVPEDLIGISDKMLYKAKNNGRNQVCSD